MKLKICCRESTFIWLSASISRPRNNSSQADIARRDNSEYLISAREPAADSSVSRADTWFLTAPKSYSNWRADRESALELSTCAGTKAQGVLMRS